MPPTPRGANPHVLSEPASERPAPTAQEPQKSDGVSSQVHKLRQIRQSLGRYQDIDRAVSAVPGAGLRRALYRRLGVEGARHLDPQAGLGTRATSDVGAKTAPRRRPMPVLGALLVLGVVAGALALVYDRTRPRETTTGGSPSIAPAVLAAAPAPGAAGNASAETLPILPKAAQPESVWLVEKANGWEQYSNGLRIETSFQTPGDARRYRTFKMPGGEMGEVRTEPVGILYHTSESDIWPLDESNSEQLRVSSQRLLSYVRRQRSYHYMIDRFGRVFRVVEEGAKANHAGHSIWTRGDEAFLNLNHAFIGICFETRWEEGEALPITQAQLLAGRTLTEYLRHRYKVVPEMCVTHGLTSVNPKKHLIGHHVDWARGFPFDAFGLPDQYKLPAPSVGVFGFGYDRKDLRQRVGEPWEGVFTAERALEEEARKAGRTVDEVRREKRAVFDRWLAEQVKDTDSAAPPGA